MGAASMLDRRRAIQTQLSRLAAGRPGVAIRLRLFGLLLLLIPLFAGLERLVSDTAPRNGEQFSAEPAQTPVPVERTVERIIYVPVSAEETPRPSLIVPPLTTPGSGTSGGALPKP
jgi:hypothetical protein